MLEKTERLPWKLGSKMLYTCFRSHRYTCAIIASLILLKALKHADHVIVWSYENSFELPPSPIAETTTPQRRNVFQPLILNECTSTTPFYYAPCFAQTLENVVGAEEVIYPGFRLPAPIFADSRPSDSPKWWNTVMTIWERGYAAYGHVYYPEQHGQIIMFENVTIEQSAPFDKWVLEACSSTSATVSHLKPHNGSIYTHERALLANTADSCSLQHFLDRASHVYLQAAHHHPDTIVTGRKDNTAVDDLWSALGFGPEKVLHQQTNIFASSMIWSCRVPTFHPWLTRKLVDAVRPKESQPLPISDRKVVMYMTRSNGRTRNPGRKVVNEDRLLARIQQFLEDRGRNETLVVFDHEDFPDTNVLMEYFQKHVQAIIGPHGGALHHHLWTGPDTLVLELQPIEKPNMAFFETVRALDQQYAVMMLDAVNEELDMKADIPAVIEILENWLGMELPVVNRLRTWYQWRTDELNTVNDNRV